MPHQKQQHDPHQGQQQWRQIGEGGQHIVFANSNCPGLVLKFRKDSCTCRWLLAAQVAAHLQRLHQQRKIATVGPDNICKKPPEEASAGSLAPNSSRNPHRSGCSNEKDRRCTSDSSARRARYTNSFRRSYTSKSTSGNCMECNGEPISAFHGWAQKRRGDRRRMQGSREDRGRKRGSSRILHNRKLSLKLRGGACNCSNRSRRRALVASTRLLQLIGQNAARRCSAASAASQDHGFAAAAPAAGPVISQCPLAASKSERPVPTFFGLPLDYVPPPRLVSASLLLLQQLPSSAAAVAAAAADQRKHRVAMRGCATPSQCARRREPVAARAPMPANGEQEADDYDVHAKGAGVPGVVEELHGVCTSCGNNLWRWVRRKSRLERSPSCLFCGLLPATAQTSTAGATSGRPALDMDAVCGCSIDTSGMVRGACCCGSCLPCVVETDFIGVPPALRVPLSGSADSAVPVAMPLPCPAATTDRTPAATAAVTRCAAAPLTAAARYVCVELKPKCGLREVPRGLPSRFALQQQYRQQKNKQQPHNVSRCSAYEPQEFFAGLAYPALLHKQLQQLQDAPQNNLRLFVDGVPVDASARGLRVAAPALANAPHCCAAGDGCSVDLLPLLKETLQLHGQLFAGVLRLQALAAAQHELALQLLRHLLLLQQQLAAPASTAISCVASQMSRPTKLPKAASAAPTAAAAKPTPVTSLVATIGALEPTGATSGAHVELQARCSRQKRSLERYLARNRNGQRAPPRMSCPLQPGCLASWLRLKTYIEVKLHR